MDNQVKSLQAFFAIIAICLILMGAMGMISIDSKRISINYAKLLYKVSFGYIQEPYKEQVESTTSNNKRQKEKQAKIDKNGEPVVEKIIPKIKKIFDKVFIVNTASFDLQFNCNNGTYDYVHYKSTTNHNPEEKDIFFNNKVVKNCEYNKEYTKNFKNISLDTPKNEPRYNIYYGANNKQVSKNNEQDTYSRANIIPVQKNLNSLGGALFYLDRIVSCHKDKSFEIVNGTIYQDYTEDDYFEKEYFMKTPDYLFKILLVDNKYYSFIFPNDPSPVTHRLNNYNTDINNIEKLSGLKLDFIPKGVKSQKNHFNLSLQGCY
jgi:hypothetical protein